MSQGEKLGKRLSQATVTVGGHKLPVWPKSQVVESFRETPTMLSTCFADAALYHEALIARLLELERDPSFSPTACL
jgi:hypothetical protein